MDACQDGPSPNWTIWDECNTIKPGIGKDWIVDVVAGTDTAAVFSRMLSLEKSLKLIKKDDATAFKAQYDKFGNKV